MNGDQLPTNQLHDINWGAFDHESREPQLPCSVAYVCLEGHLVFGSLTYQLLLNSRTYLQEVLCT